MYRINCEGGKEIHMFYVGDTRRTLKTQAQEHLKERPRHQVSMESVQILDWEDGWTTKGIKESIYIRMLHPELNADGGIHYLPPIWDNLLEGSCDLRSKNVE